MTTIKPDLLNEWSKDQFKTVEKAILNYFKKHFVQTSHYVPLSNLRSFKDVDNSLGLAYTSTSSFAMYGICNVDVYFDYGKQWHFVCFGLSTSGGFVYALLHDREENEIYFPIN